MKDFVKEARTITRSGDCHFQCDRKILQTTGFHVGLIDYRPRRVCAAVFPATPSPGFRESRGLPACVFSGMTESIGPMGLHTKTLQTWGLGTASRWSVPRPSTRARRKARALSIVRDEFRPAIP